MNQQVLFFNGSAEEGKSLSINEVVLSLKENRDYLLNQPIDHIVDYIDKLAESWLDDPQLRKIPHLNIQNLTAFMRKDNIIKMLNLALRGNYRVLDTFIEIDSGAFLYKVQPRGLAVHWLAGNVPLLGVFSIIQAIITKNVSLIKASSKSNASLIKLLSKMPEIDTSNIRGSDISKTIAIILVDKQDLQAQKLMSESADVRVAWGGKEAVESILSLPRKFYCEDIIYGPKYSYALIDGETLRSQKQKIADRLAFDISTFDQYACSSPHTVFIDAGKDEIIDFSKALASSLDRVNKFMIPKEETDPSKAMEILELRTKYTLEGEVISSKNSDWTVIYTDEPGLAQACFSRVVFLKKIDNIERLKYLNDRHKQTVGLAIQDMEKRKRIANILTSYGVDRCPAIGNLTLFESPWDGMFAIDRMVRWVTTWK